MAASFSDRNADSSDVLGCGRSTLDVEGASAARAFAARKAVAARESNRLRATPREKKTTLHLLYDPPGTKTKKMVPGDDLSSKPVHESDIEPVR
jgi:hypothetical protein